MAGEPILEHIRKVANVLRILLAIFHLESGLAEHFRKIFCLFNIHNVQEKDGVTIADKIFPIGLVIPL